MALLLKQYSSGIRIVQGQMRPGLDTGRVRVELEDEGDKELIEFFNRVSATRINNWQSVDKFKFCEIAKRLIGDFDSMVNYNLTSNKRISEKHVDFIIDTINFINGGVRELDMITWSCILEHNPPLKEKVAMVDFTKVPSVDSNYIAKWISQPDGLSDLVATVVLWFGIKLQDPKKTKNGIL